MKAGALIRFRRLPTARWWPRGVPEEGVGIYRKTVRFATGAVMALVEMPGGKAVWVPQSSRFTKFEEVEP